MEEITNQLTLEAIEQLESGKGNHSDTIEEFLKETKIWKPLTPQGE